MNFVITAGHSNTDPGAVAGTRKEADIARDMRNMVALKLRQRGHTVATDGEGEVNKPLREAIALIKPGAVAVEFHCNASTNSRATGVESISLPKHKSLAQRISKCVSEVLGLPLRGDAGWIDQSASARGRLGFVNAGGIIVELFFISNPDNLQAWESKKWLAATAVTNALDESSPRCSSCSNTGAIWLALLFWLWLCFLSTPTDKHNTKQGRRRCRQRGTLHVLPQTKH